MLDLNPLVSQKENKLGFTCKFPASQVADDALDGVMEVNGVITSHAGYLELDADFSLNAVIPCARCAVPFDAKAEFSVNMPVASKLVNEDDEADYVLAPDGFLDEIAFCETAAMLNLPLRFICREDCKGLCPDCGVDFNHGTCSCAKNKIDPRLAKLKELLDK